MELEPLVNALSGHLPNVLRWSGAVARQLRNFDISLTGKSSGSANTDALTLADLTVQEVIVGALRDSDPNLRRCRIEAEESTGDLQCFADEAEYTISIDPIDGTRAYRDRTGHGYAVVVHLRSRETVHYSLVFIPEQGRHGTWVEVNGTQIRTGEDDPTRPARQLLDSLPTCAADTGSDSQNIYVIGFQDADDEKAHALAEIGLKGCTAQALPGCVFELIARGEFSGSLIHSPNVYDFPVSLHIARSLGGDAWWVHNRQPVHFDDKWLDDRADMLRLPGIVACSVNREQLAKLCDLAKDWNPERYVD